MMQGMRKAGLQTMQCLRCHRMVPLYRTPVHLYRTQAHLYRTQAHLYRTQAHLYQRQVHMYQSGLRFHQKTLPLFRIQTRSLHRGHKPGAVSNFGVLLVGGSTLAGSAYMWYIYFSTKNDKFIFDQQEEQTKLAPQWKVRCYRALPLRAVSRLWGRVHDVELPVWLRSPLYTAYIWVFNCRMMEATEQDLKHYRNLGEFFKRRLKPGSRIIDDTVPVTCPADGKVLHYGRLDSGQIEQVKGVRYSLQEFLGPPTWHSAGESTSSSTQPTVKDPDSTDSTENSLTQYIASVKQHEDTELYHCVVYLAPGDYHGFHSPTDWDMAHRRHFPGDLLSVSPSKASKIKGLFTFNERAVYYGQWQHGFFSMVAVGATNVGSIKVYCDETLETNRPGRVNRGQYTDLVLTQPDTPPIHMAKGDALGEFNLGSTIVLIFEAPKTFEFKIQPEQKILMGQAIGNY